LNEISVFEWLIMGDIGTRDLSGKRWNQ